jgi:hypothetical protein
VLPAWIDEVVTDLTNLQQRLVKTGGRLIKHARHLLVAAGGESSDAAAVWRHAAKDYDAAGASGIGGPQSAADFGDEIGGREKCLRNRLDKRHFRGLHGRETPNRACRAPLGTPLAKTELEPANAGLKPCRVRPFGLS